MAAHRLAPARKVVPVLRALDRAYGVKVWTPPGDALEVLIRGILSQNTNDANSDRAFRALRERYSDWPGLAAAPPGRLAAAIKTSGLAKQKAATIRRVLGWLTQQGGFSLEFLRGWPDADVEAALTAIKGVGIKTARLVLLFGFGRPSFVVDTHVLRVSKRLGLVPPSCSRERAHVLLDALVPDGRKYSGHLNMIEHGRRICAARGPRCAACAVQRWCVHVRAGAG